jgi:hypothetical protein
MVMLAPYSASLASIHDNIAKYVIPDAAADLGGQQK